MTEKPDYMQMAIDEANVWHRDEPTRGDFQQALARTLEALDTERTAHEAMKERERAALEVLGTERDLCEKAQAAGRTLGDHYAVWLKEEKTRADKAEAELQALRDGVKEVIAFASKWSDGDAHATTVERLHSLLPQPAADPLAPFARDLFDGEIPDDALTQFLGRFRRALATHGGNISFASPFTITEKQG